MESLLSPGQSSAAKKIAGRYNIIPNLIWSVLHLVPVAYFCFAKMDLVWVYISLGSCFLAGFLPASFLARIQLGKSVGIYKKIGIVLIRKYSQDGDIINQRLRKKFPGYRVVHTNGHLKKYIKRTWFNERFHFMLLLFMLVVATYAAICQGWSWAVLITFNNILYNLYPIFLQQYNRLRITHISRKRHKIANN